MRAPATSLEGPKYTVRKTHLPSRRASRRGFFCGFRKEVLTLLWPRPSAAD